VDEIASYRAKVLELRARAEASATAAEASNYLELARAWETLALEAEARVPAEARALES
jgi:hypothetical protein